MDERACYKPINQYGNSRYYYYNEYQYYANFQNSTMHHAGSKCF
jgi:hypothetical protein